MYGSGHSRGAHSPPHKRASWLPSRHRVTVPPSHSGDHAPAAPQPLAPPSDAPLRPGLPGRVIQADQDKGPVPGVSQPPHPWPVSDSGSMGETLTPVRKGVKGSQPGAGDGHAATQPEPATAAGQQPRRRVSAIVTKSHLLRVCVLVIVVGVIAVGLADGGGRAESAEPTVQSFLLAWEQGNYRTAAQYTTGDPATVAAALKTAYVQLDAASLSLTMGTITQSGDQARARFGASVDLGGDGAPWQYTGSFPLRWTSGGWKVQWSLSDINPGLRAGTRLAVRTTLGPRAQVLDAAGQPLQPLTPTYVVGVQPDTLTDPAATTSGLAQATGLNAGDLAAQIRSSPQDAFLGLVTLGPDSYAAVRSQLRQVPGLVVHKVMQRMFDSIASDVVGSVGTETAPMLRQEGIAYHPGDTAGLSGLQQYYQRRLVGSPTTEVVVEGSDGRLVSVLAKWPGAAGQPVRTTLSSAAQVAADDALGTTGNAAAIVAVQASTGKILAVSSQAARSGGAQPDPLAGHYPPGQAFTIVSTAALLNTGLSVSDLVPCRSANDVGGQTFINDPPAHGLGAQPPFSADFARGCGTAFAGLSRRLSATGLSAAANSFGLGSRWRLPLPGFAGAVPTPATDAQLAADTIGSGNIQVSPLDMALIAAQVDSGTWHAPSLVLVPDPPVLVRESQSAKDTLTQQVMSTLRGLMRATVRTGAARAANLSGAPVYGQAGQAPFAQAGKGMQAMWFVGYRGDVAFAVLEFGRSSPRSAVQLASQFLHRLPASLLSQ
jgi:cell division protein FtsI/penicillin-binding protein 2